MTKKWKNKVAFVGAYPYACKNTEAWLFQYAVDANLFRLGSTNPKKNTQTLDAFWWGALPPTKKYQGNGYFFQDWWTLVETGQRQQHILP